MSMSPIGGHRSSRRCFSLIVARGFLPREWDAVGVAREFMQKREARRTQPPVHYVVGVRYLQRGIVRDDSPNLDESILEL
eukprot:scaffold1162_cov170-Amphora_coffeaeformis.AAC.13